MASPPEPRVGRRERRRGASNCAVALGRSHRGFPRQHRRVLRGLPGPDDRRLDVRLYRGLATRWRGDGPDLCVESISTARALRPCANRSPALGTASTEDLSCGSPACRRSAGAAGRSRRQRPTRFAPGRSRGLERDCPISGNAARPALPEPSARAVRSDRVPGVRVRALRRLRSSGPADPSARVRYGVPLRKIARIFNPLDVQSWRGTDRIQSRAALGLPADAGVVVCHGRIDMHRKGIDVLLDAWSRICAERPGRDLRLVLVGTGPDAEALRARLSSSSPRGVVWIDRYVNDRGFVERVLSAADVYALASRHEGFPVAPLEAMSCSRPVVAADAPGIPDILERGEESGGLVVPRGDPVALSRALGRVLDDPALAQELGRRARRRAESHFSLEVVGGQLKDFIFEGKTPPGG